MREVTLAFLATLLLGCGGNRAVAQAGDRVPAVDSTGLTNAARFELLNEVFRIRFLVLQWPAQVDVCAVSRITGDGSDIHGKVAERFRTALFGTPPSSCARPKGSPADIRTELLTVQGFSLEEGMPTTPGEQRVVLRVHAANPSSGVSHLEDWHLARPPGGRWSMRSVSIQSILVSD